MISLAIRKGFPDNYLIIELSDQVDLIINGYVWVGNCNNQN